ncbi:MAG: hypothetical protein A3F72_14630 [Bacteroidetes bacterium RIFCSPLOWO2_12_FULL_35_15]|nr:MAG: hypothetical protein A3F72_14630 [Bacteroidetes bacterium RIFCSPLOWO2_12_FULL_35_15]
MKNTFTFLLTLLVSLSFGQNYKLFNCTSKKIFTTYPTPNTTYSLEFDSVKISGTDSVYYNFFTLRDTMVNSNCPWWGGPQCTKQDAPVWIGANIKFSNNGIYHFFNRSNDTLKFNFNSNVGDTSLFYKDNTQKFSLIYEKMDTLTVLNNIDSAKFYKILHTNLTGNIINSVLNGKEIIASKNWGLVQFLQVDSFPQLEKSLYLVGNVSPTGGINILSTEMLYDYQPGDEIQYYDYYSNMGWGPPSQNYDKYTKYTFFNRITTADTLIYKAQRYFFNTDSTTAMNDTVTLKFYRFDTIAHIPFEFFDGNTNSLSKVDYCGFNLWTFKTSPKNYVGYCANENCWGPIDTNGPLPDINTTYVPGLGIYNHTEYFSVGMPSIFPPYSKGSKIVYFKKNGIECNSSIVLGIPKINDFSTTISIQPNPANSMVKIVTSSSVKSMTLFDINGKIVFIKTIIKSEESIDISQLNNGIYFAKFILSENRTVSKKIVIMKD